jgi:sec-independent protein translocase protein TatA
MLAMPGYQEALVVLLVALLLFGGSKLPELARGMGRALRVLKKELNEIREEVDEGFDEPRLREDAPPAGEENRETHR